MNTEYAYGWISVVAEQFYYTAYNQVGFQYCAPVLQLLDADVNTRWVISDPKCWNPHMRYLFFMLCIRKGVTYALQYMKKHDMDGMLYTSYFNIINQTPRVAELIGGINTSLSGYDSPVNNLSYKNMDLSPLSPPKDVDSILDNYYEFDYRSITYIDINEALITNRSC